MGEGFSVLQGTKTQSSLYGLQEPVFRDTVFPKQLQVFPHIKISALGVSGPDSIRDLPVLFQGFSLSGGGGCRYAEPCLRRSVAHRHQQLDNGDENWVLGNIRNAKMKEAHIVCGKGSVL